MAVRLANLSRQLKIIAFCRFCVVRRQRKNALRHHACWHGCDIPRQLSSAGFLQFKQTIDLVQQVLRWWSAQLLKKRRPEHEETVDACRSGYYYVTSEPMRIRIHPGWSFHIRHNGIERFALHSIYDTSVSWRDEETGALETLVLA